MIKPIFIFQAFLVFTLAGRPQTSKVGGPFDTYNIINYGAKPDGITNNTAAIQSAVDDCHNHGGGKIVVPTGKFVTGTIRLYSNMNFYLEAGALLAGAEHMDDYPYQKDFGFTGPGAGGKTGILVANEASNISVTGSGTIYGNGDRFMYLDSLQQGSDFDPSYTRQGLDYMNPKYGRRDGPVLWKGSYEQRPGVMVIFSSCKNIRVSDIRLEGSPNWTIAFLNSEDIKVEGISIKNNMDIPNSDGIDFYDSKNITISNCFIQAGDDAIAVVSSSLLTASHCILQSRSSGIRIGYNVFNDNNSGNLIFDNIVIHDSNRGIGIFQRRLGDMENISFSNMIISTRLHSGQWWGHGEPIHISAVPGLGNNKTGSIRHVRFSNITATSESGILIYGSSKGAIRDISFDNVQLTIRQSLLQKGYGGNFDLRPVNNIAMGIFSHSIPALYANFADGLQIRNLKVEWGPGLPSYFDHAIGCSNFENLFIDGVTEQGARDSQTVAASTIFLERGKAASVNNIISSSAKTKVVQTAVIP